MQPMRRHVPPSCDSFSTHATLSLSCAARMAAVYPPGPAPITTRSCWFAMRSDFQKDSRRTFDIVLNAFQKCHRLTAIDDAVVVAQSDIHHRTNNHLALHRDRTFLNR